MLLKLTKALVLTPDARQTCRTSVFSSYVFFTLKRRGDQVPPLLRNSFIRILLRKVLPITSFKHFDTIRDFRPPNSGWTIVYML